MEASYPVDRDTAIKSSKRWLSFRTQNNKKVIIAQSNQMADCQEQRRRMRATLAGKYVPIRRTYGKGSQKRRIQATLFSSNPIVHCPPDPQRPIRPLRFCCRSPWRTVLDWDDQGTGEKFSAYSLNNIQSCFGWHILMKQGNIFVRYGFFLLSLGGI